MKISINSIFNKIKNKNEINIQSSITGDNEYELYSADSPITDPLRDEFGRQKFSERISQTIIKRRDKDCLIMSINGKWGEGKSTVLNFITAELVKHPNIITINFNPWNFSDETELFISFYKLLASKLNKNITRKQDIGKLINEYLVPFASVDKTGTIETTAIFGAQLSKIKLEDLKNKLNLILDNSGKKLVVIMDDVDRLDKKDLHTLFKLIKLSANLNNLIYILAFDDEVVADALQERYGTNNRNAGRNFLEKIIQVPMDLPMIEKGRLRNFCLGKIQVILEDNKINLDDTDSRHFLLNFDQSILPNLGTPREIIRYTNILAFSLPLVTGEVNISDFLLIEAIRTFYPNVYDVISSNKEIFIGKELVNPINEIRAKAEHKKIIEKCFESLDKTEPIKRLIISLFPRVESIYENINYPFEFDKRWSFDKKVCSEKYFDKYFLYSIPQNDVSDSDIDNLFSSINEETLVDLIKHISSMINPNNTDSFLYKIKYRIEYNPPGTVKKLAQALLYLGEIFSINSKVMLFSSPLKEVAIIIAKTINLQPTKDEKLSFTQKIISDNNLLPLTSEILSWLNVLQKNEIENNKLTEGDFDNLFKKFAERIEFEINEGSMIFEKYPSFIPRLINIMSKYISKDYVNNYIKETISRNPDNIFIILHSYLPTIVGSTKLNRAEENNFELNEYNSLKLSIDPEIIYSELKNQYGDELLSEQYPNKMQDSIKKIYSQFMWLHQKKQ